MIESRLGIGPMSLEVIDAVIEYARKKTFPIMLIASRNQIECDELGGGYVNNFTTSEFARYIRKRSGGNVVICRDHSGPYMSAGDLGLSVTEALERSLVSIKQDIESGFDIIHIDTSMVAKEAYKTADYLLNESCAHAAKLGRKVLYEIGAEQKTGRPTSLADFKKGLDFFNRYKHVVFMTGQTGSLIKEMYQVGYFDLKNTKRLSTMTHKYGFKFKEHNVDYLSAAELGLRSMAGVDAINIAPEFGVMQTKTVVCLAQKYGIHKHLEDFLRCAMNSRKWEKWAYGKASDNIKAMVAGHYVFSSESYLELISRINRRVDVSKEIFRNLTGLIDHYARNFR